MEACTDEKWKLSKKGRSRSGRAALTMPPSSSSMSNAHLLSRSYSATVSSTRDAAATSGSGGGQQHGSSSATLSKKCAEAVKQQRARFYIVRRCVSMLVCWRDY